MMVIRIRLLTAFITMSLLTSSCRSHSASVTEVANNEQAVQALCDAANAWFTLLGIGEWNPAITLVIGGALSAADSAIQRSKGCKQANDFSQLTLDHIAQIVHLETDHQLANTYSNLLGSTVDVFKRYNKTPSGDNRAFLVGLRDQADSARITYLGDMFSYANDWAAAVAVQAMVEHEIVKQDLAIYKNDATQMSTSTIFQDQTTLLQLINGHPLAAVATDLGIDDTVAALRAQCDSSVQTFFEASGHLQTYVFSRGTSKVKMCQQPVALQVDQLAFMNSFPTNGYNDTPPATLVARKALIAQGQVCGDPHLAQEDNHCPDCVTEFAPIIKAEFAKLSANLQSDLIDHSNNIQKLLANEQTVVATVNAEVQAGISSDGATTGVTTRTTAPAASPGSSQDGSSGTGTSSTGQ